MQETVLGAGRKVDRHTGAVSALTELNILLGDTG